MPGVFNLCLPSSHYMLYRLCNIRIFWVAALITITATKSLLIQYFRLRLDIKISTRKLYVASPATTIASYLEYN